MSREDESSLPAILIGLVLVVAVLIGGLFWFATKKNEQMDLALRAEMQAREDAEFRERTGNLTLWRDSEKVEDVEKAKRLCEEMVVLVKRKGEPQSPEEKSGRALAKVLYGKAKRLSDSCIDYLIAGIERRFDKPDDDAEIKKRMEESDKAIHSFSWWANDELNHKESGIIFASGNTFDRLPRWVDDFNTIEHSAEELAQIKATLEKCRLRNWDEIE
jgi:hypothetical protein